MEWWKIEKLMQEKTVPLALRVVAPQNCGSCLPHLCGVHYQESISG